MPAKLIELLKSGAVVVGHVLTALVTTAIVESDLWSSRNRATMITQEYIYSSLLPFIFGWFIWWKWRSASAKWIWIIGVYWFGQRGISYWLQQSPYRVFRADNSVFREMSGIACYYNTFDCGDFFGYTVALLRTVFYSLGALCGSLIHFPPIKWHKVFPGFFERAPEEGEEE